jgi:predicted ATP-binding protein involved in virulence
MYDMQNSDEAMNTSFANDVVDARLVATDREGRISKRNEKKAAAKVVRSGIQKLAYLQNHGIEVSNLKKAMLQYYSQRKLQLLQKNHARKYMHSLMLGTFQCNLCKRWFEHEGNLK